VATTGEDLAFGWAKHLMNGDNKVSETDTVPATRGRTGVAIGILIVTLVALAFYFYWRATGMRDEGGRRPPPREISAIPAGVEAWPVG
jgi:hypothetical protein